MMPNISNKDLYKQTHRISDEEQEEEYVEPYIIPNIVPPVSEPQNMITEESDIPVPSTPELQEEEEGKEEKNH